MSATAATGAALSGASSSSRVPLRTRWGVASGEVGGTLSIAAQNTWLLYFLIPPPPSADRPVDRLDRAVLRTFWQVREFRSTLVLSVVLAIAVMIGNATLPFFLGSVLGMDAGEQSASLAAFFAATVLAIPLWALLARRIGKPRALALGTGVYVLGLALFARLRPTTSQLPALGPVVLLTGVGLAAVQVLPWAMLPDCAEHVELAGGVLCVAVVLALRSPLTRAGCDAAVVRVQEARALRSAAGAAQPRPAPAGRDRP